MPQFSEPLFEVVIIIHNLQTRELKLKEIRYLAKVISLISGRARNWSWVYLVKPLHLAVIQLFAQLLPSPEQTNYCSVRGSIKDFLNKSSTQHNQFFLEHNACFEHSSVVSLKIHQAIWLLPLSPVSLQAFFPFLTLLEPC